MSASLGLSFSVSGLVSQILCPPPWYCLLVSQLVSHLVWDAVFVSSQAVCCWGSLCFLSVSALPGMLCPPCWACLSLAAGLVSHLVFQLVCVRLPGLVSQLVFGLSSQLVSHVVFHLVWDAVLPAGLGSCVRALGLSPKFHVRFVQLFGVYGGVIFNILWFVLYVLIICFFCICMCDYSVCVCECTCTYVYMQLYVFVCCLHISACILMHPYVYLCHGSFCVFLRLGPRVFYVSLRGFMHLMYPYHSLCVSMYLDVCLLCLWVFLCLYIATACKC